MRRFTAPRAALLALVTTASLCMSPTTHGGAESPLDRYRALLQEKMALERENSALAREADLARSDAPYILLDPQRGTLSFRVRGKSFKEYHFTAISSRGWGRRPIVPEALWKGHDGPLTIKEKEGGRKEIVPPSDDEPEAGDAGSDQDQETDDAVTLGVKAPDDYDIRFEENVVFHVQSERRRTLREKAVDRASELAADLRDRMRDLWGGETEEPMVLYLLTDAETARNLYHSILPGERIFISPPPPPDITLIARRQ